VKLYIIVVTLLLSGCATTEKSAVNHTVSHNKKQIVHKDEPYSIKSIITNHALKSYKNKYVQAKSHKAFAQSKSGVSYWKSDRTSRKHAIESALVACQVRNVKAESMYPCKVINIDGVWVTK
jgi:hypothetical protein